MSSENLDTRTRILEATWKLLEEQPVKDVSMSAIAKQTGISRQALYLHFTSRTDLMVATTEYVDEVKGLYQRMEKISSATSGTSMLEAYVDVWGSYMPEIYGIAKALLRVKETDEAASAAWYRCMHCLRDVCQEIINTLAKEGKLSDALEPDDAVDYLLAALSIEQWELLTQECGWSDEKYVSEMKRLLVYSFVD
jgi:AcrR family transcriptional regulator